MNEGYPDGWVHAAVHLNPETGELHVDELRAADGPSIVREWILARRAPDPEKAALTKALQDCCDLSDRCGQKFKLLLASFKEAEE